jgi:hypothetical protein
VSERKTFAQGARKLEIPGVIRQVETHLIFGPLSRHFPLAYIILAVAVIGLVVAFFSLHQPVGQYVGTIAGKLIFLFLPFLMLRMTLLQQAIIGFLALKITQGIAAFMMLTIGFAVSLQRHQSDAWPNFFLGLIWLPSVEFLPRVTPHQKYVTIARLLLSIPLAVLKIRSGYWSWQSDTNNQRPTAPDFRIVAKAGDSFRETMDNLAKDLPSIDSASATAKAIDRWAEANKAFANVLDDFLKQNQHYPKHGPSAGNQELQSAAKKIKAIRDDHPKLISGLQDLVSRFRSDPDVEKSVQRLRSSLDQLKNVIDAASAATTQ